MKNLLKFVLLSLIALQAFGCSRNYYNVPRDSFEKKVRTIGVAPIFVDADSDIRHPEKDALVTLVKETNRLNEPELVAHLRDSGGFFLVRPLEADADKLFADLLFRRERRDDADIVYNKYFFKGEALRELITRNNVDAVMVVVVSGLTHKEKVYAATPFSYLDTDYNYLTMTGQIIDADGMILWEYPNFRQRILSFPPLFPLQYPDFDEAKANETDRVEVHFKTMTGITRAFGSMTDSSLRSGAKVSRVYETIFTDMMSVLGPEKCWFGCSKSEPPKPEAPKPDVSKSETTTSVTTKPDTTEPDAPNPDAAKPDLPKPDTFRSDSPSPVAPQPPAVKH